LVQGRHSEDHAYDLQKFTAANKVERLENEVKTLEKGED